MTLMLDTSPLDLPEIRFSSDKVRFGKPLEASLGLHRLLGLADNDEVERLRGLGESAIVDEILANTIRRRRMSTGGAILTGATTSPERARRCLMRTARRQRRARS